MSYGVVSISGAAAIRNSKHAKKSLPVQTPVFRALKSQTVSLSPLLAVPGKTQIRFQGNAPSDTPEFLDKYVRNSAGRKWKYGEILLDFFKMSSILDGQIGLPDYPAPGNHYPTLYSNRLAQGMGFNREWQLNTITKKMAENGFFTSPNVNRFWERVSLSQKAKEIAVKWEAKEAKRLFQRPEPFEKLFLTNSTILLNREFTTPPRGKKITIGEVLVKLLGKKEECDYKPAPPESNVSSDSRYFYEINKHFTFEDPQAPVEIMQNLSEFGFISKPDKNNWKNIRLTAFAREAVAAWKPDFLRMQPEKGKKGGWELEYGKPFVDLKTRNIQEIKELVDFDLSSHERIDMMCQRALDGRSAESMMAKTWLTTFRNYPWLNETRDTFDIHKATDTFDEDIYGMESVKERVLEQIASNNYTDGNKGGIILFVGPPGVGKTAVGRSIAKVLGRSFVRETMGGADDAHKVSGHEFTYMGAEPGLFIKGMIKGGTKNPVFQLDEMEKSGQRANGGNVHAALLHALDPDQHHAYVDEYMGIPVDLSKVLFIATANSLQGVPPALLDRCQKIEFFAYLPEEKLEIAVKHLIPRQQKIYKDFDKKLQFDPDALLEIIQNYTNESGVRDLERRIEEVFRKASVHFLRHSDESTLRITRQWVEEKLTGRVDKDKVDPHELRVGEVNGLYATGQGGGIVPVQVALSVGQDKNILTGLPGEVMQQSQQVALSYLREHAEELGVIDKYKDALLKGKLAVHVHYPSGSIPKEGPSAGSSTFLALWSKLTQSEVPAGIALTGEIDLVGRIKPIGGILEKISGSISQGVTTIYLPKANENEYKTLRRQSSIFSHLIDSNAKVEFVSTLPELLQHVKAKTEVLHRLAQQK